VPRASGSAETAEVVLEGVRVEPDRSEILRYLGYPAQAQVPPWVTSRVEAALQTVAGRLRPRGIYRLYQVECCNTHALRLAGGRLLRGRIGEFLGSAQQAAVFLATAGPEITAWAEQAMRERDILSGLIYHALGAALAEAMVECIVADLRSRLRPGEALTMPYSPGYCGIPLSEQRTLFELIDAGRVGVELLPTLIMRPLKSVSGVIGIGPAERVQAYGNPCHQCPLTDCRMRR